MSVLKSYRDNSRKTAPSKTYRLFKNSVAGRIDGKQAMVQAIELMLSTERWRHAIYSADYGYEIYRYWGNSEPPSEELLRVMTEETLLEDDRILSVESFSVSPSGDVMNISFIAKTVFGDVSVERSERIV